MYVSSLFFVYIYIYLRQETVKYGIKNQLANAQPRFKTTAWSDARGASRAALLIPFLQPRTEVLTMYTTLMPSLEMGELCANPVTELCPMTFPTSLTPDDHNKLNQALVNMRMDGLHDIPEEVRPRNWWMGHVDRPGKREHPTSPSGEAFVVFMLVGWESVEAHKMARETEPYKRRRDDIRGRMLPTGTGLLPGSEIGMTHAKFVEIYNDG